MWVIVVASVLPSLFLLGWVESFLWFRQLMPGRKALRFGTVCWILMLVVGVVFHAHVAREEWEGPGRAEDTVGCYECRNEVEALVEVGN